MPGIKKNPTTTTADIYVPKRDIQIVWIQQEKPFAARIFPKEQNESHSVFSDLIWLSVLLGKKNARGLWGHRDKGLYEGRWKLCVPGMTDGGTRLACSCTDGIRCQQVPISPIRVEGNSHRKDTLFGPLFVKLEAKTKHNRSLLSSPPHRAAPGVLWGWIKLGFWEPLSRHVVDSRCSAGAALWQPLMLPLM